MAGKKLKTILTYQDAVIAEAIDSALPETQQSSFVNDLSSCVFDHEEDGDFVNAWNGISDACGLRENESLREKFNERDTFNV
ncbi:hypothetical protein POTOM_002600 [Populus tomentosa]|uniref:Uncharacterized protein n=1 Tax=Populus tomentosa TaxID=118781 RepID=A0A8X8IXF3_POPTO|nr:hypothetical protein POTOM_002600 [Populus tomentosa]